MAPKNNFDLDLDLSGAPLSRNYYGLSNLSRRDLDSAGFGLPLDVARSRSQDALERAYAPVEQPDFAGTALSALIPFLLAGATSGKEGRIAAGPYSALAGQSYQQDFTKRQERDRAQALQEAEIYGSPLKAESERKAKEEERRLTREGQLEQIEATQDAVLNRRRQEKAEGIIKPGGSGDNTYKEDTASRLEARGVAADFDKLTGGAREKAQAIAQAEDLLRDPSGMTAGALGPVVARSLGHTGVLTERDITSSIPRSLYREGVELYNYLSGQSEGALTARQTQALKALLDGKRASVLKNINSARKEIKTRADMLAPSLSRAGRMDPLLDNLGSSILTMAGVSNENEEASSGSGVILDQEQQQFADKMRRAARGTR